MMRLIDADAALERVKPYSFYDVEWTCTGATVKHLIHDAIDNAPTVDAVPIVRCKDCRYFGKAAPNDKGFCICPASNMEIVPDDFCSYGERKDE